jgi:hypothetical protein
MELLAIPLNYVRWIRQTGIRYYYNVADLPLQVPEDLQI